MLATVLEHISDKFEPFLAIVIGVGDFGDLVFGLFAKCAEACDCSPAFLLGGEGGDVLVIAVIHGEDEIKVLKILSCEMPSASGGGDASVLKGLAHPAVGPFPCVPVDGARGVDFNGVLKSSVGDDVSENILSCW